MKFTERKSRSLLAIALPVALMVAAMPITPALAQASDYPPVMDDITLSLAQEGWVETNTARVVIRLEAAGEGADAAAMRNDFQAVLAQLDADADWRFLSYDRRRDDTGLERWTARAEARLPETGLDGLSDEADEASRPGLAVRVETTDFSPTLADREAAIATLRQDIYERAVDELAQLDATFPDRQFRLAGIDFEFGDHRPAMMERAAQPMQAMDSGGGQPDSPSVAVAERIEVRARVRLSAFADSDSDTE